MLHSGFAALRGLNSWGRSVKLTLNITPKSRQLRTTYTIAAAIPVATRMATSKRFNSSTLIFSILDLGPLHVTLNCNRVLHYAYNSQFTIFHHIVGTHLHSSCLDAVKEARLRASQSPEAPGLDFSSQLDVSTVSSARATMPSV